MNKSKTYTILTIFSILIVENHGGLIDHVYGTFKNTTQEVTSGVGSLLSFGKGLVIGNHHPPGNEIVEEKKGIVRGFIDSVHHNIHDVHEKIRHVFVGEDKNNTKGIIGNIFDRMKNRVAKVTEFLTADSGKRKEMLSNTRDDALVAYQNFSAFLFGNGTMKHSSKLREIINKLKDKIKSIAHRNNTESDTANSNTDGTGLIDIRVADDSVTGFNDELSGTKSRLNQGIDELNKNVARNRNYIDNNIKEAMDKENELMKTGKTKIEEGAVLFRD